jgi:hypothetical protein
LGNAENGSRRKQHVAEVSRKLNMQNTEGKPAPGGAGTEHHQHHHEGETGSHEKHLEVVVTNENNGKTETFSASYDTRVETIIERMYASSKLGIGAPSDKDRLRCKSTGENVFQFRHLHLKEFSEKHCKGLHWLFAGPTGGA